MTVILFILLQLGWSLPLHTPEPDSIYKHIKLTNEKELHIEVELNSCEFEVSSLSEVKSDILVDMKMKYDSASLLGDVEYEKDKGIGRVIIKGEKKNEEGKLFGFKELKNKCSLSFTRKVPLYLDMKVDMGKSNIDLSGLKVAKLNLSTSGTTIICFNLPNPIICKDMYISASMSKFKGEFLGNAMFDVFHFRGGVGSYTLDLRSEFKDSSAGVYPPQRATRRVEIMMSAGSLKLILPKEAGIRLKPTGISLKSVGNRYACSLQKVDEGWYQSENWGVAESELIIHIDGSFGIVKIETL